MQNQIKENLMLQGVIMKLPETIYIETGSTFVGECTLEPGVVIKGECHIENSTIKAHSVIENSILINADAGPMARIRPGSHLEGAHVGNFVEVKNSHLKNGVKAGHLSYIGDASIGERTNIGAGTITCNYDGINKYKTIIEEDVFIGSDTQLVAPVTIKKGSMIGAGSTITKDVEEGSLALSRTKQSSIAGFSDKFFNKKGDL
jgi:bifunctional UDP-N-acetylglucosamine pyrophosphorylase/glucosamine-1-phosphate N-acetyltransferase